MIDMQIYGAVFLCLLAIFVVASVQKPLATWPFLIFSFPSASIMGIIELLLNDQTFPSEFIMPAFQFRVLFGVVAGISCARRLIAKGYTKWFALPAVLSSFFAFIVIFVILVLKTREKIK